MEKSLCVVLCSKGYPDQYKKNVVIKNINKIQTNKDEFIFHAGTKMNNSNVVSDGGRVLNFVVKSKNFSDCRVRAISLINEINWENGFFEKILVLK